ncbi:MAG TPA: hypothetical protein PLP83_10095 [Candidatus Aminicenantes bacterium]|nr:hypothetical protein [Candidatus Aminicenantes bacterium]
MIAEMLLTTAKALAGVLFFAAVACGTPGSSGPAAAQESFPDMPTYDIFTREELGRDFIRIEYDEPLGRSELGFLILVPKSWQEVPITVSRETAERDDENLVPLALLQAPEDGARIEVAYVRVPQDPALEEWARAYLESAGLEVLRYQTGAFSGRAVFDTLLKAPGDYKVRMTFSRHGDKIYIVSGSAPVPAYEKFMRIFGVAAVSFSLL